MLFRIAIISLSTLILCACNSLSDSHQQNQQILQRLDLSRDFVDTPTNMMQAAKSGDSHALKLAFAQGEKLNSVSPQGSAFSLALKNGHQSICRILLAAGTDSRLGFDNESSSALIVSAEQGFNDIVKLLITREAEINHIDDLGYSALAKAAINGHLTTVKLLIHAGADVDVYPEDQSLLMHVVADNNMLIAQQLIAAGADLNYRDSNDDTALRIARRKGYFDLDLMLIQAGAQP